MIVTIISVAVNVIQFLNNKQLKKEMKALHRACGNYFEVAGRDKGQRNSLHARAEGVMASLWESLGHLSK
jgi:hypothetical protein